MFSERGHYRGYYREYSKETILEARYPNTSNQRKVPNSFLPLLLL